MEDPVLDLAVVGGSLAGLHCARSALRGGQRAMVVERAAEPGGSARTRRTEGFVCELGPFALARREWDVHAACLDMPPPRVDLLPAAHTGWRWDGTALAEVAVADDPCSGVGGCEDLVTAYRRELDGALRLGREVTALRHDDDGWQLELGGEAAATVRARTVALAMSIDAAARLCARLHAPIGDTAARLRTAAFAHVFLGLWQDAAATAALRGYGVLATDAAPGCARELLFCSNAFPRRAVAGKALVRVELHGDLPADDDALAALGERELRNITGWTGDVLFRRVQRGTATVRDSAFTECRLRLQDLAARAGTLSWLRD